MAAPYNPPKKNEDFEIQVALNSITLPGTFQINPTIASGDFKISKDGGALANLSTLPAVEPASSALVTIALSSTEMNADVVTVIGVDQTAPKEWADIFISIATTA